MTDAEIDAIWKRLGKATQGSCVPALRMKRELAAVLRERERAAMLFCATVAMNWEPTDGEPVRPIGEGRIDIAAGIAARIRNLAPPPAPG